ncbi:uncharacterized protein LOC111371079 [Olea europaea var. sylvestris]|uniref:uncharacterized protein LOC111371079 n=1 Tax=Olea europaea var. sylvestris TaxID=158386 RepID=UPI000C1CE1EA|nr:uncharacterized protein LOC111371079 [Olea europaea var. sylvestris]
MRDNGWDNLLSMVIEFYVGRYILVPNLEDIVVLRGRPKRIDQQLICYRRFYVDLYCYMIDSILQEFKDLFLKTTTELLICILYLSPRDSFAAFEKVKLLHIAQFYHLDFKSEELLLLRPQLNKFLMFVRMDDVFFTLNSVSHADRLGFDIICDLKLIDKPYRKGIGLKM